MTYVLRFLPTVEADVRAGYTWYEAQALGLGEEFLRMFYASAREMARQPLLYPTVYRAFRRRLLRRFPYAMYFQVVDEQIIVFGLFHCARDPRALHAQLRRRGTSESPPQD